MTSGGSDTKPKILVIDDSEIVREMLMLTLSDAGYDVATIDTQFATAHAIVQHKPALVLLDVSMPGLDGDQIVRVLRNSPVLKDTTVVLHSDRDEQELIRITEKCGADGYIPKSIETRVLLARIQRWVPLRRRAAPSDDTTLRRGR